MPTVLAPLDLVKNELRNARVQNLSTAPSSPVTGQLYYDTDDNKLYWWNGSSWVAAEPGTPTLDFAETADMVASAVGDTADGGVSTEISRGDHRHAREAFGGTTELANVDAAAEAAGSSATVAHGDHKHQLTVGTVTAETSFGSASNNGSSNSASRTDHQHGNPTHDGGAHSGIALSSLAVPTGPVSFNGQLLTSLADPVSATDAATKQYVDGISAGIAWKETVRAATTVTGTLATAYENNDVIDGVTLVTGDRILIKNQSTASENGIYTVNASGAPTRATDADSAADILQAAVFVQEGTTNADSGWVMTTNAPITLNTTGLTFVQFTGLGSITAGNGLTQTGNTLDVVAGTGIVANANDVAVLRTDANGRVPLKFAANYGDNSATSFNIDHNLNSLDVIVQVFRNSDGVEVEVDKTRSTVNRVVLTHAVAPTSNQYRCVVYG